MCDLRFDFSLAPTSLALSNDFGDWVVFMSTFRLRFWSLIGSIMGQAIALFFVGFCCCKIK